MTWAEYMAKVMELSGDPAKKGELEKLMNDFRAQDPLDAKNRELLGEKGTLSTELSAFKGLGLSLEDLRPLVASHLEEKQKGLTPSQKLQALQDGWNTERTGFEGRIKGLEEALEELTFTGAIRAALTPKIMVSGVAPEVAKLRLEDAVNRAVTEARPFMKKSGSGKDLKVTIDTTAGSFAPDAWVNDTWSKSPAGLAYVAAPNSVGGGQRTVLAQSGKPDLSAVKVRADLKSPEEKSAYVTEYGREAFEGLPLK